MTPARVTRALLRLFMIAVAAGAIGCSRSSDRFRPNVLLITLDTTRADRIGAYGYGSARTPVLDQLAKEGVLFERAYAPIPLTLPSHASVMTGLYPPEHGLRTNGSGSLPQERTTLSEALSRAGYQCGAFVASYVLDRKFGLDQGFHAYDDDLSGATPTQDSIHRFRDGKLVVDSALKWLAASRDRPFFCWVHLYDPHAPYDSHAAEFDHAFDDSPYDGEIAYTDRLVGRIVEFVRQRPGTVIIVAGDHGEGLGDHSELEHGYTLYDGVTRVPLIIQGVPGESHGHRVRVPVSLVDIYPTVMDLLNLPLPAPVSGRSLVEAARGRSISAKACYGMTDDPFLQNGWAPLRSLTTERWRYIRTAKPELYDLAADPLEITNLAESDPARRQELEILLADFEAGLSIGEASRVQLSDAEQRALASLGYVGGSGQPAPPDVRHLPDVKDMLPFNVLTQKASELIEQKRLDEAEALLLQVISESPPEHYPSRLALASVHEGQGRIEAAEEIYQTVLKSSPDNTSALYPLGGLYAEHGRYAEALKIFEHCLTLQPDSAQALYNLGLVRARLGQLERAQRDLEEALQLDAAFAGAWVALGNVYARQGRVQDAASAYESELAANPSSFEAHVNLAVQLVNQSRLEEARRHLEEAVRLAPENVEARFNLAICCDLQGDREAAIEHLDAVLKLKPGHAGAAAKLLSLRKPAE